MPFLRLQFGIQENSCARCKAFYWTPSLISEAVELKNRIISITPTNFEIEQHGCVQYVTTNERRPLSSVANWPAKKKKP